MLMIKGFQAALAAGAATCAIATHAMAADTAPTANDEIVVTGAVATQESSSATGLPLSLIETPQSVTIVDRQQIRDFALTDVNDLLDQVPGVNVERAETDRTQYDARGFTITNFQVDGIGLPLLSDGIAFGSLDTALWDRVETVRGANGMMTGVGNPSATINYVRKRPTADFQASLTGYLGSYDDRRIEGDISGPLDKAGTIQARLIAAHEDSDSYLDYYHLNRDVVGVLVAWDITPRLKATAGYSRQQNDARGNIWGALPLVYADGGQIDYPRSASTAAPWTYWNTRNQSAFGELRYDLGGDWSVKGVYTFNRIQYRAKLLYADGTPDRETGLGITGSSGRYDTDYKQDIVDAYASGPIELFGRRHDLAFGVSTGRSSGHEYEAQDEGDFDIPYPAIGQLGTVDVAEPAYPDSVLQTRLVDRLTRAYGAAHWNLTDRLKAITGFAATWLRTTGYSYGVDNGRKNSKVTPYVGALYDVTANIKLYASYTGIFSPQSQVDIRNARLAPATGNSIEGGVKGQWLGGKLYATAALFRARQKNLAQYVGSFEEGGAGQVGGDYYVGQTTTSKGFELEVAGRITPDWTLSGGYTSFSLRAPGGARALPYIPNRTFKLSTTYAFPELRDLKLGADLRWQDGTHIDSGVAGADGTDTEIRQRGYAVVDLMASVRLIDRVTAAINVRNVTDRKYLNSLAWGQAYYAEPRTVLGSLSVAY
jgi:outer membrane receptor for ferric coprogen and ferric-rhodotorulic acid